uniref:Glycosyltransferase n=1 Tax=candidate division WOR-3 bacterium TaxID=2052148 RepID=A0A7C4TAK7_UNCW3
MQRQILKNLLIISYYWPPCGGPGSLRAVKFAKYLPHYGIEPIILTRKNIAYHSIDPELGSGLKNLKVYRTESFDPARILYILGMRRYRPKGWQVPIKKTLNFPDNKVGWIPFAYNRALKIDFDYIFVTAPPFSSFIAGYLLSRKIDKPLILDFRDAWLEFPFIGYENKIQRRFVVYWEEKVVNCASLIITVSENIKEDLLGRYPLIKNRVFAIPNGYDPDDFSSVSKSAKFTIAYLGTIRKERNPENVLKAVEEFIKENQLSEDDLEMKFIGHIDTEYLKMLGKYPFIRTLGHLPHLLAIREFCSAHIAVMITTGEEFFFPSRQIEYLASGLPIICCGSSSGIEILKNGFRLGYPGWIYEYNDVAGMKERITELFLKYKNKNLPIGKNPFSEYTRKNLTEKLVKLIKEFIPH